MVEATVRKIAKSYKYQLLYDKSKEMSSIRLFRNDIDFTGIQLMFLRWLEIYHSLYEDLALKKEYISQEVIDDNIRAEAYLLYRDKNRGKKEEKKDELQKIQSNTIPSVIFRKRGNSK